MGVNVETNDGRRFIANTPKQLVEGTGYWTALGTPNLGRTYDASPDGRRFLRMRLKENVSVDRGRIIVVENWTEELKRLVPVN